MNSLQVNIETLNSLLRGELAAVETYDQALDKFRDTPEESELERLRTAHVQTVDRLRQEIRKRGGAPSDSSGAWGWWAQTVEGAATMLGRTVALKALKEGEEHGVREYEEALEDENLDSESRMLITTTLMPQARSHVPALDGLMDRVG